MKKERLEILIDLYNDAIDDNALTVGTNMNVQDLACGGFDLQYLEDGGYVKLSDGDPDKGWQVYITAKGVDVVEEHLDGTTEDSQSEYEKALDFVLGYFAPKSKEELSLIKHVANHCLDDKTYEILQKKIIGDRYKD